MLEALLQPLEVPGHLLCCLAPDHEWDKQLASPAALEVDTDRDVQCRGVPD